MQVVLAGLQRDDLAAPRVAGPLPVDLDDRLEQPEHERKRVVFGRQRDALLLRLHVYSPKIDERKEYGRAVLTSTSVQLAE
ncbi:hypothetical protein Ato02nite_084420 [Paractinoplanes toevensis]|uniref:Uncharacterized protein n=1 Tax=Paractinoplanes toevensis TaxID=571911 RepID=A0A919WAI5_9ACTN|nr:hypothetical protein Ato02nite_084420 [Actinoplanes toevensis]